MSSMHFPAALYLPPDAFDVASNQVIGRRIAGRLVTKAFAANLSQGEMLTIFSPGSSSANSIQGLLNGVTPASSSVRVGGQPESAVLQEIGAIHFPDPSLGRWSALRQGLPPSSFSLTGVIHTICSDGALKGLGEIPLSPVYPWDAIVCTSRAGRDVVASVLEQRLETMLARYHPHPKPDLKVGLPQLPVIPLSGPTRQPYEPRLDRASRRLRARARLGIEHDAFVVVFVGRLSFHSKSHPLALYRALEGLARACPSRQVVLVECGHIFNSWIGSAYEELRKDFPGIHFRLVGGLEPASEMDKWQALAAADVFTSLADNLQETFGLSLLEAMMAELPLVVTDWNGYRDLVEHGVNGFLVPTADVLAAGTGVDEIESEYFAERMTYDVMIGLRSLGVVVEHGALCRAFKELFDSPDLRLRMEAASLKRIASSFSPAAVASAYRNLYAELADRRRAVCLESSLPALAPSYRRLFAGYATASFANLAPDSKVDVSDSPRAIAVLSSSMNQQQLQRLSGGRLESLLSLLRANRSLSLDLLTATGMSKQQAFAVVAALVKFGLVAFPNA